MNEPLVRAAGLTKKFDDLVAVDSVDFTVSRGEVFGFLGPNGAHSMCTHLPSR
jgi:ABC-type multidrug transport system ATPase subunit